MAGNSEVGPSGTAKDNNSSGKYYFCQMHPLFPWIPSSSGSGTIVVIFKCSNTVVIACLEFNDFCFCSVATMATVDEAGPADTAEDILVGKINNINRHLSNSPIYCHGFLYQLRYKYNYI